MGLVEGGWSPCGCLSTSQDAASTNTSSGTALSNRLPVPSELLSLFTWASSPGGTHSVPVGDKSLSEED